MHIKKRAGEWRIENVAVWSRAVIQVLFNLFSNFSFLFSLCFRFEFIWKVARLSDIPYVTISQTAYYPCTQHVPIPCIEWQTKKKQPSLQLWFCILPEMWYKINGLVVSATEFFFMAIPSLHLQLFDRFVFVVFGMHLLHVKEFIWPIMIQHQVCMDSIQRATFTVC